MNEMFPGFEKMKMLTIQQAANHLGISRQAVYIAIAKDKIRAQKHGHKYLVSIRMLDDYVKDKYNRRLTLNLKYNEFTPQDVARKLGIGKSAIYYMIRSGMINSRRIRSAYIISQQDINLYLKKYPSIDKVICNPE